METDKEHSYIGAYELASEDVKELASRLAVNFHYRNCVHHEDGSRGEIKITPKQLMDVIAYAATHK